jgi:excisionase family DNA binding protein
MAYEEGIIKRTEFFTTSELAKKLKMNVQVITRKVQSGEIQAYKIGKDWRIPEQSVYLWLERHSNQNRFPDRQKVVSNFVTDNHIAELPTQRSKRKYLLEYILAQFEPDRAYSEEEVNRIIGRHHDDFGTVRREFLAEGMMRCEKGRYRRRAEYRLSD